MKLVNPIDQIFFRMEKHHQPMHVGALQIFSFPEDAGADYVTELAATLRTHTVFHPPFNQYVAQKWGQYFWGADDKVDLTNHFRHTVLPKPGGIEQLLNTVSVEHGHHLNRGLPLWETHLIEGVGERKFALYIKVHHALMDGVSGIRLCTRVLSDTPETRDTPPFWATPPAVKTTSKSRKHPLNYIKPLVRQTKEQIATLPTVSRELLKTLGQIRKDPAHTSIFQAPKTAFNQPITNARHISVVSLPMDRVKTLRKKFNATINDIVLAISSSALRQYLLGLDELPRKPMIAQIPVSIRDKSSTGGNQVVMLLANLATHIDDPIERIALIKASVDLGKKRFSAMNAKEKFNYTFTSMAPFLLFLIAGLPPVWPGSNVVISNIPGPRQPMYLNGAVMEAIFPVSVPVSYFGLNITLISYDQELQFGITACKRSLAEPNNLMDYFQSAIEELETC